MHVQRLCGPQPVPGLHGGVRRQLLSGSSAHGYPEAPRPQPRAIRHPRENSVRLRPRMHSRPALDHRPRRRGHLLAARRGLWARCSRGGQLLPRAVGISQLVHPRARPPHGRPRPPPGSADRRRDGLIIHNHQRFHLHGHRQLPRAIDPLPLVRRRIPPPRALRHQKGDRVYRRRHPREGELIPTFPRRRLHRIFPVIPIRSRHRSARVRPGGWVPPRRRRAAYLRCRVCAV
mmetsp:Transcript_3520/g.8377  ORF Transcript_3520/g.8377 Transcript_3520/m.8377 type:complete len:232 (-) Transcript_3520:484-1179(-)